MRDVNVAVTEEYVDYAVRAAKQDMKVWLMGSMSAAALALAVPMVAAVFYLGSMNSKLESAFKVQDEHATFLATSRVWMDRRERNEENLTAWAKVQGYAAPERVQ